MGPKRPKPNLRIPGLRAGTWSGDRRRRRRLGQPDSVRARSAWFRSMAKCNNGGLDLGEAMMEDDRQRRLVEDGVVARSVAGVHQTGVFPEGGVPGTVVAVLDDPMTAVERQQPLGVRLLRIQRGHAVGDLEGFFVGLDLGSVADHAEDLPDLRIVDQTPKGFQDLDLTPIDAAMSLLVVFREARRGVPIPVDGLQGLEGLGRVALDREQVVCPMAAADGESRVAGGVQGIQGDHRTPDIDILQQGEDRRDLASLLGIDPAGDGHGVGVADQGDGLVVRLPMAVGAAQTFAVRRQRGFRRLPPRHPTVHGRLKGFRVGVGQGPVQGRSRRGMVATGPLVAPSAEQAQLLLSQRARITPSGVHAPVPGQTRQPPDRQQGRQLELAALSAAMVRDRGELFEQRGQGEGFGAHRLRAFGKKNEARTHTIEVGVSVWTPARKPSLASPPSTKRWSPDRPILYGLHVAASGIPRLKSTSRLSTPA